jgi:hypothetical protein
MVRQFRFLLIAVRRMAKKAPIAADWLTEKKPENIPPSTIREQDHDADEALRDAKRSLQEHL